VQESENILTSQPHKSSSQVVVTNMLPVFARKNGWNFTSKTSGGQRGCPPTD